MESCVQFGVAAIRHHVTVTSLPPACQRLTRTQIDFAVGSALHSAAIGARGKAAQRARIGEASKYLDHLLITVPLQRSKPQVTTPASGQISRTALGLITLGTWLITIALGLWMMARWILRSRARRPLAGRLRRPPARNFAHLGLAGIGLLIWIAYLATGVLGLAWTDCALLALVTGLGMTLAFLPPPASPAGSATAHASPAATAGNPGGGDSSRGRRPPVFAMGAHVVFATITILFAFLTAIGVG